MALAKMGDHGISFSAVRPMFFPSQWQTLRRPALLGALAWMMLTPAWAADLVKLQEQLRSSDLKQRREAIYELGKLGPASAPALPALLEAARDDDKQVWTGALDLLAQLGPAAAPSIPFLIEGLGGEGTKVSRSTDRTQTTLRSANVLAKIGAPAVPALVEVLEKAKATSKAGAARALSQMGAPAASAVPALIGCLGETDEDVCQEVVEALGQIGEPAVPGLLEALSVAAPTVRKNAALALGAVSPSLPDTAAPAVLTALEKETEKTVRAALLPALAKVHADPARTTALFMEALQSDDEALRHAGLNALLGSPSVQPIIAALATGLEAPKLEERVRAATLLGRLKRAALPAVPALLHRAEAEPKQEIYANTLAQIGPAALPALLQKLSTLKANGGSRTWIFRALNQMGLPALEGLAQALHAPTPAVRAGAASAMEGMPLEKHPAVKTLLELTTDSDPGVRAASLRTLADVRSERHAILPKLEAALNDPDPGVQRAAAISLAVAGSLDKVSATGLLSLLEEDDPEIRTAALQAVGGLGAQAAPAVPTLIRWLSDPQWSLPVAEALSRLGAVAQAAVPALIAMTERDEAGARVALPTLGKIGPPAAPILPWLYQHTGTRDEELMITITEALTHIETDDAKLMHALTEAVENKFKRVRKAALKEFRYLGDRCHEAQAAVPAIVEMLDTETERNEALKALEAIGPTDVAVLTELLGHNQETVRALACESLGKLGANGKPALERLKEVATSDPNPRVQQKAQSACKHIERESN